MKVKLHILILTVLITVSPAFAQHYCQCVGQDNTIGATFDANWKDSILLEVQPTPEFGDASWAWFDIGLDYPAITVVGVWGRQDSGVQMKVMSSPDKHNNWPLDPMGRNPDTGYYCRYYTFKTQPGYQQRYIAITRPLNDTTGYVGIDCVQVWYDQGVAPGDKATRAISGQTRRWVNVLGVTLPSLEHAPSGLFFEMVGGRVVRKIVITR